MSLAYTYIRKNKIGTEQDYPYEAEQKSCRVKGGDRYAVRDYSRIHPYNVKGLSNAIVKQPVSVAIEVRRDF